ncbi:MAG: hypothetical protein K0S61_152 [Anaerocolumna sp.]|jgi:hypothetical protein|nr:hypothetical protein [Anaerocolumna sp.]
MVKNNIVIENAKIGFRNFSGKEGKYNPAGRKNFCVFIDSDLGQTLENDGWNVRWLEPKDSNEEKQAYLQVTVSFGNIPPKIVIISSKGKTVLDEESISILDWAEIKEVDLIIRPYNWTLHEGTRNEKSGVKAYIKSMYVTIHEDKFESKYYDVPDSAVDSIGGCGNCDQCDGHCEHDK